MTLLSSVANETQCPLNNVFKNSLINQIYIKKIVIYFVFVQFKKVAYRV